MSGTVGTKVTAYTGSQHGVDPSAIRTTTLRTNNRPNTVLVNTTGLEVFNDIRIRARTAGSSTGSARGYIYECIRVNSSNVASATGNRYLPTTLLATTQTNTVPSNSQGEAEVVLSFVAPYTPPQGINLCLAIENLDTDFMAVTTDNANETGNIQALQDSDTPDDPWKYTEDVTRAHAPVIWADYTTGSQPITVAPPESVLTSEEQAYLAAWGAGFEYSITDPTQSDSDNLRVVNPRVEGDGLVYELMGNYINWDHELENYNYIQDWKNFTKPAGRDFGTIRIDENGLLRGNYIHTDFPEDD